MSPTLQLDSLPSELPDCRCYMVVQLLVKKSVPSCLVVADNSGSREKNKQLLWVDVCVARAQDVVSG